MTVNNYQLIRDRMKFDSPDCVYHGFYLKRRKDKEFGKSSAVLDDFYITSLEYFDSHIDKIIATAEASNARAVINLNRKSIQKVNLRMAERLIASVRQNQYSLAQHMMASVMDEMVYDGECGWFIDMDADDGVDRDGLMKMVPEIDAFMTANCHPLGVSKVNGVIPSKTGLHVFINPCNLQPFTKKYPQLHIQTNAPTNLYIPDIE
ncbi:MAG: hypothetical protein MJZ25_15605 [Fibrobacter sp.]|nr:hypothetical protein [Fibrobacter sp.]